MTSQVDLFDIDGTILSTPVSEEGERLRYLETIREVVGKEPYVVPSRFAGMVDPQICKILLTEVGLSEEEIDRVIPEVLARIGERYREARKKLALNTGVEPTLKILTASTGVVTGILTGNLKAVAEEKLRVTGIRSHFSVLFCGDNYFDRTGLVKDAVQTCIAKYRLKKSSDVVIVGDTPRDIEAANASQATSVGIASGIYSMNQLHAAKAAHVYASLEPTPALLTALGVRQHLKRGD